MTAYDYDRQKWVEGDIARDVRLGQVVQTLETLRGPRGAEFARFICADREAYIASLDKELKELQEMNNLMKDQR